MSNNCPFLLVILDGLALNPDPRANAVLEANTPTLDRLLATFPHTTLTTHGPSVGLPPGQMGNSEVGHLNIGAGRVVEQELSRIDRIISSGGLRTHEQFQNLLTAVLARPQSALHLIGLASPGGVHSQEQHLLGLVSEALSRGLKRIVVHAITDGRDRPPTAAQNELTALERQLDEIASAYPDAAVGIGSIVGRYFAMDRDKRWERTRLAFDLFTTGAGTPFAATGEAIAAELAAGRTDEFFSPRFRTPSLFADRPHWIENGDSLLFFNFRADRMKQIVSTFLPDWVPPHDFAPAGARPVFPVLSAIATLTEYDDQFPVTVLFRPVPIVNHLGEVLSKHNFRQLRSAETEKYAHVTYFFNGGVEEPYPLETRVLVPSPRDVATYDQKPEMSAYGVTENVESAISSAAADVFVVNFANCDMVGHTGSFPATVRAVEVVDSCLARLLDAIAARGGAALVTADHGNADQMIDYQTGGPHTFHTMHPVPCILFGTQFQGYRLRAGGALCDLAPTVCELLGVPQPAEMTGRSLIASR